MPEWCIQLLPCSGVGPCCLADAGPSKLSPRPHPSWPAHPYAVSPSLPPLLRTTLAPVLLTFDIAPFKNHFCLYNSLLKTQPHYAVLQFQTRATRILNRQGPPSCLTPHEQHRGKKGRRQKRIKKYKGTGGEPSPSGWCICARKHNSKQDSMPWRVRKLAERGLAVCISHFKIRRSWSKRFTRKVGRAAEKQSGDSIKTASPLSPSHLQTLPPPGVTVHYCANE